MQDENFTRRTSYSGSKAGSAASSSVSHLGSDQFQLRDKVVSVLCKQNKKEENFDQLNLVTRRAFKAHESSETKSDQSAQCTEGKIQGSHVSAAFIFILSNRTVIWMLQI